MKSKQLIASIAAIGCVLAAPGLAHAGELEEMKAMLLKMQSRIDQLEAQKSAAPAPAPAAASSTSSLPGNPSATFYGKLDVFTEYDSQGSKGTRAALESGGLNGSRWGVKGSADLGKNLKGVYQLEGGIFVNNGLQAQGGRLFGRQAYTGIEGNFGRLTVGRQYSPLYNTVISFDPYEQGYGSPTTDGNVNTGATRFDSSIVYNSPKFNGFSASAMAALGGNTGSNKHDATALAVNYGTGPVGLAVAYQKDDHISSATSIVKNTFAGASYQLGNTKLMGGFGRATTTPDSGLRLKHKDWMIGSQSALTASGLLLLAYGQGETENQTPSNKGSVITAGWVETLTAQTKVYAILSNHKNNPGSALVPMGTSSASNYVINPGDSARGLALGFQYAF